MPLLFRILTVLILSFSFPAAGFAQEAPSPAVPATEEIFKARVVRILEEKTVIRENGSVGTQQDILLEALDGSMKGKTFEYEGISEFDYVASAAYRAGDKVMVQMSSVPGQDAQYYILDYVRRGPLYALACLFALVVVAVGRWKGFKALFGLAVSFFIIINVMLPAILNGRDPLLVGVCGAFAILVAIIYLTEGWQRKSHLAVLSVFCSLTLTMILSVLFTGWTRLTGLASEEAGFLMSLSDRAIDFEGLLLAGMLVGAVGVLDDVIVGQIEAVRQIKEANPSLSRRKVLSMAYKVGNTHLGAIVNTLFLTYAGASLPLLLLFTINEEPFVTFGQVINNELIATEIVRTFVGSIGVALSMPIATALGAYFLVMKPKKNSETVRLA